MSFQFESAGESHGKGLIVFIKGLPAGLTIELDKINKRLKERMSGYGRGKRMNIERDCVEVVTGLRGSKTLGSPLVFLIKNNDYENWSEYMDPITGYGREVLSARPGHADFVGALKYNFDDMRNVLERASARETASRVAAGAVAEILLENFGVKIGSFVTGVGEHIFPLPDDLLVGYERSRKSIFFTPFPEEDEKIKSYVDEIKLKGDTLGGSVLAFALNVIPGIGSYTSYNERLSAIISFHISSIPATKAVEIGLGSQSSRMLGSEFHDEFTTEQKPSAKNLYGGLNQYLPKGIFRRSNFAGGIEGGMSNGEPIIVKSFMKPIPSTAKPLNGLNIRSMKIEEASYQRSDVLAIAAYSVIVSMQLSIALAGCYLKKFGSDNINETLDNFARYKEYIFKRFST
ncbi:chorismate synthase [Thermodesulfobium narugense DSM 14796]|uniref:Chorismate synthase n=1 Tax=Thermodesulfobium narugense DSM 14796 TaxID=747365 RepID=M1E5U0_9BACT|nr:chorismate synthase [Thermodesulfobium narugense]AEE15272.1 chorismate synthase [Thermodesulfobium narugense DSM 14796]